MADFVALSIVLGCCLLPLYILSNIMRTQEYFHGVSVVWLIQGSKVRDLWASIESRPIFRPDTHALPYTARPAQDMNWPCLFSESEITPQRSEILAAAAAKGVPSRRS